MTGRRWALGLWLLLHLLLIPAELWAPHDPNRQHRSRSFAPPTTVHWSTPKQGWVWPFVYDVKRSNGAWVEDRSRTYPLRFLSRSGDGEALRWLTVESPAGLHWWGTDRFGRDVLSRALPAARLSIFTGLVAATLAVALGLLLGSLCIAGGRRVDAGIMRLAELTLSLPWLYLLIAVRSFLPLRIDPTPIFVLTIVMVALLAWPRPARLVRGEMSSALAEDYVTAARGFGASRAFIFFRHLLPHCRDTLWTQWALLVPQCVMAEVTLSLFGLGAEDSVPSLGNLLIPLLQVDSAIMRPWMFWPAIALGLGILSYHLCAESLRRRRSSR